MTERTHDEPGAAPSETAGGTGACGGLSASGLDCQEALHDLYSYLDGEITDERRATIRVHIEECGPCLDAFDFEVELRQLVARTCQTEAPDSLRARVAQAIHECDGEPNEHAGH